MRSWERRLFLAAGLAAVVAVSSIAQAVRSGSWGPVVSVAWVRLSWSRLGPRQASAA